MSLCPALDFFYHMNSASYCMRHALAFGSTRLAQRTLLNAQKMICGNMIVLALFRVVQHRAKFQGVDFMAFPRSSACCRVAVARYWREVDVLRKLEKKDVSKSAGKSKTPRQSS